MRPAAKPPPGTKPSITSEVTKSAIPPSVAKRAALNVLLNCSSMPRISFFRIA